MCRCARVCARVGICQKYMCRCAYIYIYIYMYNISVCACVRDGGCVYACVKAINRRRAIRANLILGGTNDFHLYCLRLCDLCFSVDRHGGCC